MKTIIAVDQNVNFANQIIDFVISHEWPQDSQFKILSVVEPLQWQSVPCIEWNQDAAKMLEHRKRLADEIAMNARRRIATSIPDSAVHVEVRIGRPKEEIIDSAAEWMSDRIILGAHGHSANRFFKGSVARSVSQYCGCTIQLVRLKNTTPESVQIESKTAKLAHK